MYKKIPLFEVLEKSLITLKGSIVIAFRGKMLSYEGMRVEDLEADVNFMSSFVKSFFSEDKSFFGSVIAEVKKLPSHSLFQNFLSLHSKNVLGKEIAEKKVEKMKDCLFRDIYFVFEYPVFENLKEFNSCKNIQEKFKSAFEKVETISDVFEKAYFSNYGEKPQRLTGLEMWQHLFRMINPYVEEIPQRILDTRSAREQLFLDDVYDDERDLYLRYNGTFFTSILIDMLPATVNYASGTELFFKIPSEVRMTVNFEIPRQVDVRSYLSSLRNLSNIFSLKRKGNPESEKNKAKVLAIDELLALDKELISCVNICFTLWGKNKSELEEKVYRLQNTILTEFTTAACYINRYKKAQAFISGLGYFPSYMYFRHFTTLTSAFCFLPYRSYLAGTFEEPVLLFSNRANAVTSLSLFTKRQNRWSFLVIGPTGSGKSFVTNNFLLSHLSMKAKIVVFDMASMSSYKTLAELCGGEYIEVKPTGKGMSRNVFDFKLGFNRPPESKYIFLDTFFSYILSDVHAPLIKEDYELLRRALKRTYERVLEESPKLIPEEGASKEFAKFGTWVNMRDVMLEKALKEAEKGNLEKRDEYIKLAEFAHRHAMPVLEDLSSTFSFDDAINLTEADRAISSKLKKRLNLYLTEAAKRLFGSTTKFSAESDFVVVNLGFLRENVQFLVPAYFSYREYFWDKMAIHFDEIPEILKKIYGEQYFVFQQTRPKILLVDEYHNFNAAKEVIYLTDKDMRQTRTYGIALGIVTQSLRDVIYEEKDEKFSIFESAANRFFLRHSSPQNPQKEIIDYVVEKTGMNEKDRDLLISLKLVPGKYSEIYYLGEEIGKGVIVYEPLPIEVWINTTHKGERYVRDGLIEKLKEEFLENTDEERKSLRSEVVFEVIKYLSENYPEGMVYFSDEERIQIFQKAYKDIKVRLQEKFGVKGKEAAFG